MSTKELTPHQLEQWEKIAGKPLAILGGGPGTGKTFLASKMVSHEISKHGREAVCIGAPTGKAAVRVTQSMKENEIAATARTWHGHLGVNSSGIGGWSFDHDENNPMSFLFFLSDESSMMDTTIMARVMSAIPRGASLVLTGDTQQLPPVGHGAPLRDMIEAGVPYAELSEIHRNSGMIVDVCHKIRKQEPWSGTDKINIETGENLKVTESHSPAEQISKIIDCIYASSSSQQLDPVWDCQVIVPLNDSSPLGRKKLNEILQNEFNTNDSIPGLRFRLDDKVVNNKNGILECIRGYDEELKPTGHAFKKYGTKYVANGEQGRVVGSKGKTIHVAVGSDVLIVPLGKDSACNFDLAYAVSCHKCVSPETIVETANGLIPIREIWNSGIIGTPNGEEPFHSPVYFKERACLNVTTKDGAEITVTKDHRCEAWTGEKYELIEAEDLKVGQFIRQALFPTCEPSGLALLPTVISDSRAKDFKTPFITDIEVAELLGLVVADGCVYRGGVKLGKRHSEVTVRFCELCKSLFGIQPETQELSGMLLADVRSTKIRNWLYAVGGCYPKAKHVPTCIMRSNTSIQRAFIRGLFEDGTVNEKDGIIDHIEWSTCFPRLHQEVRVILSRLGFICGQNSQRKKQRMVYIYGMEAKRFGQQVGFISKVKQQRTQLPAGSQSKYMAPVSSQFIEDHKQELGEYQYRNILQRRTISRHSLQKLKSKESKELLRWHHSKIKSIEPVLSPAMCVTVPGSGRFMQNGFPWGNSQGSQWPVVVVAIDEYPGAIRLCDRSWVYTAISRAEKLCFMVGKKSTVDMMCSKSSMEKRKTFLPELILQ